MELMQVIKGRRTIREFRKDSIADEVLNEILEAATWAPSHFNAQPWEFLLIGDETRTKLQAVFSEVMEAGPLKNPQLSDERKAIMRKFIENFGNAPIVLAVTTPPGVKPTDHVDYPLAAAAAIQNMLLTAWERKIGGVWLSLGQQPKAKEVLNVPADHNIIGIVCLGYFDNMPELKTRVSVAEKLKRLP